MRLCRLVGRGNGSWYAGKYYSIENSRSYDSDAEYAEEISKMKRGLLEGYGFVRIR